MGTNHLFIDQTSGKAKLVYEYVEKQARSTPHLIALQFNAETLTYRELDELSSCFASALLKDTFFGSIVAFSTTKSLDLIVGILGILKAGKTYLPLDPSYPINRLKSIIGDAGLTHCICLEEEVAFFESIGLQAIIIGKNLLDEPYSPVLSIAPIYVLHTSGSTGKPKGVVLGNDALVNLLEWQNAHSIAGIGTKTIQLSPLTFDPSFLEIFATLSTGGTLVLVEDDIRLDPERLLKFIVKESIHRIYLPYVALQYLTDAAEQHNIYPSQLQEVITAGEALKITPPIIQFFTALPNAILYNQYGPTETHVCTALTLTGSPSSWGLLPSIGLPITHTTVFIVDDQDQLLPKGEIGELYIGGICLADGYLNAPDLTRQKFILWNHPIDGPIRVYKTGDLAIENEDGNFQFLGRKDDQIKIRGYRVEPGEIEVALSNLSGIQQAIVIADEDANQQKRLVAYLLATNERPPLNEIREQLLSILPDYMIPALFEWIQTVPKTSSGKIDKKALPKPSLVRPIIGPIFIEAQTMVQQKIVSIWRTLLSWNQIGLNDHFFELGGNSLLAMKANAAIKKEFSVHIPISTFYRNATVDSLAKIIEGNPNNHSFKRKTVNQHPEIDNDIAIIGMNGRFPGADSIEAFWKNLVEAKETVHFFTDQEIDITIPAEIKKAANYVKARGIINEVDLFDAGFFGIPPALAVLMDPQQRIFLEIAWEVLEANGYSSACYDGIVGVFAGTGNNTYYLNNVLSNQEKIISSGNFSVMTNNEKDYIASRTAYALDLKGPAISVYAACATSLLAVAQAVQSIRDNRCEIAVAGGVSITSPVNSGHFYQDGAMFSKDGHTRPFDSQASGTVFSDGAGVVLLKRKTKAIEDGDFIYGCIKGIGINNDGYGKGSFSAPSVVGQATVIDQAIADAQVLAKDIVYVETHGTATPLGDPIEFDGLKLAFGEDVVKQACAIGSVKSNIGHLTAAAGVAGLIKTALMFQNRKLVPSLFYENPNPEIDIANSPFYVNTNTKELPRNTTLHAGISSFGVGGTNVHVILSSYENKVQVSEETEEPVLICWSAKSIESLQLYAFKLVAYLKNKPSTNLADLAYTLHLYRTHFTYRYYVVANSVESLISLLNEYTEGIETPGIQHSLSQKGMDWVAGKFDDFESLYENQLRIKLIDVPTYAFHKKSYWISPVVEETKIISTIQEAKDETIEQQIKQIIIDVSGEEESLVTNDANFIAIGLDSLVLTQLAIQFSKFFTVPISFRLLNEELDNINALAKFIRSNLQPITIPVISKKEVHVYALTEEEQKEISKPFGAIAKIEKKYTSLLPEQETFIQTFIQHYNNKTALSKSYAETHRSYMADPRVVSGFKPLIKEMIYPIVVSKSKGAKLWDIDGNEYIDALNGFGSNFLGFQDPILKSAILAQVEEGYEIGPQHIHAGKVCQLICELTQNERAALCNTGSEAVLGAIRIARTVTGRSLIVSFNGSYHGINDEVIVRGTKQLKSYPAAPGILPESVKNILVLDYGTTESLQIIAERAHELAAILVEPVQSRRPEFQPIPFLKELRTIATENGTALIFDEVITGFRAHPGGVQAIFDIKADITTYGKILGGGMPIGAIAGSKKWMDSLDGGNWQYGNSTIPEIGVTYFAGTFVRHPLALAGAMATLELFKQKGIELTYQVNQLTNELVNQLNAVSIQFNLPFYIVHFSSLWKVKMKEDIPYAELIFGLMRAKGIHMWDSFPCFLTASHTMADVEKIVDAFRLSAQEMINAGFFVNSSVDEWMKADAGIIKSIPMIPPQQEIWMSCKIGGGDANRAYNESVSLKFDGVLNIVALEKSIADLIERHESLRMVCSADGFNLFVFNQLPHLHDYKDLTHLESSAQEHFIASYLKENAFTTFDLINGPLLRVAIFNLSSQSSYLCITAHHIIADGWSLGNLLLELSLLYSANVKFESLHLAKAPLFSDYAKEQENFMQSVAYHQAESYWMKKLTGLGSPFSLPTDYDRPEVRNFTSNRLDFHLDLNLVNQLTEMGANAGCSLVTTLLSCFEVLLYKITYSDHVIIGLPAAGQPVSGYNSLIGHCVNLMPLVSSPKSQLLFLDYLKERKRVILNDYEHQQLSFGTLIQQLPHQRKAAAVPLVPIVLNIDIDFDKGVKFEGLNYQLYYNPRAFETFEIFLNISGGRSGYTMEWSYNTSLYKESTITQMMEQFTHLLKSILAEPTAQIGQLTTVDQQLVLNSLTSYNQTFFDYPKHKTVFQLFEEKSIETPSAIAIRFEQEKYTYQELNERANQIAHALIEAGLSTGTIVAVCVNRSIDMVAAVLGVYKSGAAFLALDPDHPVQRIASFIEKANVQYIITEHSLATILPEKTQKIFLSDTYIFSKQNLALTISTEETSFILFTSGSTGEPKAVMLTHKGMTNVILGLQKLVGFTNQDKLLFVTTIIFDLAQADIFLPLVSGGELILTTKDQAKDGQQLLNLINTHKVTYVEATPATYKFMLATGWEDSLDIQLTCCGEVLANDLAIELKKRCKKLYNMYGPTECTIYSTAAVIDDPTQNISIGFPFPNMQVFVLNEDKQLVPPGVIGELYIAGDGVAKGYLNDTDLTSQKFVPCNFSTAGHSTMFKTGDLVKVNPDGSLAFYGRKDNQVKIRGLRIEMGEIEFHLRKLIGVKDAVAVVSNDFVKDNAVIIAYLVVNHSEQTVPSNAEIHQWREILSNSLPAYFIPNFFIKISQLPQTSSGKIDRKQLPKPDIAQTQLIQKENKMISPLQEQLRAIWSSALGVTNINIEDDFFELGGHSLIAIQVMTRVKKETGHQIPISALFQYSSIEKLSRLIETTQLKNWSCLVPIKPTGTKPPLFLIHGDGLNVLVFKSFSQYIDKDQPIWGIQAKGLDGKSLPKDSIQAIAAEYLVEIEELYPKGPYNFAGYSFGGLVAYELTKQLKEKGKTVNFIGILDTNISNESFYHNGSISIGKKLIRQFSKLTFIAQSFVIRPVDTVKYQQFIIKRKSAEFFIKLGLKEHTIEFNQFSHEDLILQNLTKAYQNYTIQAQPIKVDLFRCKIRPYFVEDPVYLGWKKYATAGVEVLEVPGDHKTFLFSPNDKFFADCIQAVVNKRNQ